MSSDNTKKTVIFHLVPYCRWQALSVFTVDIDAVSY